MLDDAIKSTSRALEAAKPPITALTISSAMFTTAAGHRAHARCIASFPSLRRLDFPSLWDAKAILLFSAAAQLPNLDELMVRIPSGWIEAVEGVASGFSALRRLDASTTHSLVEPLLSTIQSTRLEAMVIDIRGVSHPNALGSIGRFAAVKHFNLRWSATVNPKRGVSQNLAEILENHGIEILQGPF